MAYIWINPVTDSMYETDVLNEQLRHHGYERFETSIDWLSIVKEKYRLAACQTMNTIMDMRCPKIRELLEEIGVTGNISIPEIKPILIHCGLECSSQEELRGEEKIITTPCQALADMGNSLELKDTRFVPWNQFAKTIGIRPMCLQPKESPIPPGFFDELGLKTVSITGEEEIRNYFEKGVPNEVQLVEMLFCEGGCHNGDGIKRCEE